VSPIAAQRSSGMRRPLRGAREPMSTVSDLCVNRVGESTCCRARRQRDDPFPWRGDEATRPCPRSIFSLHDSCSIVRRRCIDELFQPRGPSDGVGCAPFPQCVGEPNSRAVPLHRADLEPTSRPWRTPRPVVCHDCRGLNFGIADVVSLSRPCPYAITKKLNNNLKKRSQYPPKLQRVDRTQRAVTVLHRFDDHAHSDEVVISA